jgi:hypothetical protein
MKLLATVVFLLLACFLAPAQKAHWEEFVSPEGGFSVLLPEKPTPSTVSVDTEKGTQESHTFSYSDSELTDYLVAYARIDDPKAKDADYDQLFDKITKGLLFVETGKVTSKIALDLEGNPGREVMIEHEDGSVKIHRFYLVGDYFYQLSVEVKKFENRCDKTDRFLNSFKLVAKR